MGTYDSSTCNDSLGQVVARWTSAEDTVTFTGDRLGGKCPVPIAMGCYPQRPLKRDIATQAGHVESAVRKQKDINVCSWLTFSVFFPKTEPREWEHQ